MEEMRMALWSALQDIDHSLTALETVARALAAAGSVSAEDMDNVMWHMAETLQGIRAQVDEAAGMTVQMKAKVGNPEGFQVSA